MLLINTLVSDYGFTIMHMSIFYMVLKIIDAQILMSAQQIIISVRTTISVLTQLVVTTVSATMVMREMEPTAVRIYSYDIQCT